MSDILAKTEAERAARQEQLLEWERQSDARYGRSDRMRSGWWILPAVLAGLAVWIVVIGKAVNVLFAHVENSLIGDAIGVAAIAIILIGALVIGSAWQ